MQLQGKHLVVGLFGLALAAAAISFWYQYQSGRRAMAFWGGEGARLLIRAPQVAALQLVSADEKTEGRDVIHDPAGRRWRVAERRDAEKARGLINVRRGLLLDTTYLWEREAPRSLTWRYGLELTEGEGKVVALFAPAEESLAVVGRPGGAVLFSPAARGLAIFFEQQFPPAQGDSAATSGIGAPASQ